MTEYYLTGQNQMLFSRYFNATDGKFLKHSDGPEGVKYPRTFVALVLEPIFKVKTMTDWFYFTIDGGWSNLLVNSTSSVMTHAQLAKYVCHWVTLEDKEHWLFTQWVWHQDDTVLWIWVGAYNHVWVIGIINQSTYFIFTLVNIFNMAISN